jgi:hypothetical protein
MNHTMNIIDYKVNVDEVIERLRSLYERQARDSIFAVFEVPSVTLADFRKKNPEGFCNYPNPHERIGFWNDLLKERMTMEDDSVPSAYLSEFDQGLYGGLLGGNVQFMSHHDNGWISSMISPLLHDWTEFESLRFDASHPWFHRYIRQLNIFVEASIGKFGISHFILIDGLNFVFELLGATATYMSLLDSPKMVQKAIDFGFDLNLTVQNTFFDNVPGLKGGTYSNMVQWIPGRVVSESIDPFHMTSVDDFEKWGREPVERMLDNFDGGVLHIHGNGRHLLEVACTIRGLKAIYMGDDKGFPPAFELLDELRPRAGDMPLVVQVDFTAFWKKLNEHRLHGGVLYQVKGAPDIDTVNRCMKQVRAYRVRSG